MGNAGIVSIAAAVQSLSRSGTPTLDCGANERCFSVWRWPDLLHRRAAYPAKRPLPRWVGLAHGQSGNAHPPLSPVRYFLGVDGGGRFHTVGGWGFAMTARRSAIKPHLGRRDQRRWQPGPDAPHRSAPPLAGRAAKASRSTKTDGCRRLALVNRRFAGVRVRESRLCFALERSAIAPQPLS
jgi:hypothetical protein